MPWNPSICRTNPSRRFFATERTFYSPAAGGFSWKGGRSYQSDGGRLAAQVGSLLPQGALNLPRRDFPGGLPFFTDKPVKTLPPTLNRSGAGWGVGGPPSFPLVAPAQQLFRAETRFLKNRKEVGQAFPPGFNRGVHVGIEFQADIPLVAAPENGTEDP
jgi:hypothetical protein